MVMMMKANRESKLLFFSYNFNALYIHCLLKVFKRCLRKDVGEENLIMQWREEEEIISMNVSMVM